MQQTVDQTLRKRFGQHFLRDDHVIDRIVDLIEPRSAKPIVEIGPGEGVLTGPLLEHGANLTAIEIDRDLAVHLEQQFERFPGFTLVNMDVLKFDFETVFGNGGRTQVVGNLPYNISTPLIMTLIRWTDRIESMVFMLQREVAERITAGPGSRQYGRLSVVAQRYLCGRLELTVPAEAFNPPPKVESAVVRLWPREPRPTAALDDAFDEVVRAAFGQRRKTLANTLRGVVDASTIQRCGIDPAARAETLSVEDFEGLAQASR